MKIYIVTSGCYSDYHIDAVFLEKEQAEYYCASYASDEANIEEYDTDDHAVECKKSVYKHWEATFDDAGLRNVEVQGYSFDYLMPAVKNGLDWFDRKVYLLRFATARDKNEEQAQRIATDLYAEIKYNKEMGIDPNEC